MSKATCTVTAAAAKRAINMSPASIRAWARDPRSKLASFEATRERLPRVAELKAKPAVFWDASDCALGRRVVSFVARMGGMRRKYGCKPKIVVSLRNWGHAARGCALPSRR